MSTSEFFVCHMIDGAPEPEKVLERWPLHMTVVPPFILPSTVEPKKVLKCINDESYNLNAIKLSYGELRRGAIPIEIGHEAMFGEYKDIPVVEILDPSGELHRLHSLLISELGRIGCQFINFNPDWNGPNYSPHANMKSGKKLDRPFFCTSLTLCEKNIATKSIHKTIDLCH